MSVGAKGGNGAAASSPGPDDSDESGAAASEPQAAESEPRDGASEPQTEPQTEGETAAGQAEGHVAAGAGGQVKRTSRRFPLFTRDTARPEGGGRAASGDAPAPARQWPLLVVIATVAIGLLLTALDVFRVGTILIGVALIAGAVLRWALPDVGMLAVRSRFTDMVTYGVLGVAIVLLALMAQPRPWLEIPFLSDTLHRTITT
ncbi:DUF3017 domain-containing protein [Streptomyces sp. NBC_01381]|uniref:DUF3017 domain-containing protein n=1 Tax=Streptomyces sp. NBC_01381 TaxID=2903845 RepID=UPI0022547301|nr:DUF3017 domain-containing protein [Streptomyces sp. NBC_01381]MCX4669364.1 DUF3017 domain-containing protein [Streptomyces sp. NBC_01381]